MKKFALVYLVPLFLLSSIKVFCQLSWEKVEAGSFSSLALRSDGTIWSWGFNDNGQLGHGNNLQLESPVQIGSSSDWKDIAMGAFHCLAIKNDGSLWAWGLNGDGQVGSGSTKLEYDEPFQIGNHTDWTAIAAGQAHSMALKADGSLWTWGLNSSLQLGTGDSQDRNAPVQIGTDTDWEVISAGGGHSHAIKSNGELWAWGNNGNGQLGNGNNVNTSNPVKVGNDDDWWKVDGGFLFTLALKNDSTLYAWGDNNVGQVGNGIPGNKNTPVKIGGNSHFFRISAGSAFSLAIQNNGDLYGWGLNQFGQLGIGNQTQQAVPVIVGDDKWDYIVAAEGSINNGSVDGFHTLGLQSGRKAICGSGNNNSGQLGIGNESDKSSFDCSGGIITAINFHKQTTSIRIYPNPATNSLKIENLENEKAVKLEIINQFGVKVFEQNITQGPSQNTTKVDLSGFAIGIYYLNVYDIDGVHASQKFVISR